MPPPVDTGVFITRRRRSEWAAELALAEQVRPNTHGGVGWLKPTIPALFRRTLWNDLVDTVKMSAIERLIARSEDETALNASLWLENSLGSFSTRLTLMYLPGMEHAATALLTNAVRRFRSTTMTLEHPFDDANAADLLRHLSFALDRSVWHMRLDLLRS